MRSGEAQAERRPTRGFTLIELIVVLAIVALLASVAAPRYFQSLERARENTLRSTLLVLRDAIDQFVADKGRYPASVAELAQARYVREVPEDPMTGRRDSWVALSAPPEAAAPAALPDGAAGTGMADVRSGAAGRARDGRLYADW